MLKKEAKEVVDYAYEMTKKALAMWHDYSMQQIRLESANKGKVEESRQRHLEHMDEMKSLRLSEWKETKNKK